MGLFVSTTGSNVVITELGIVIPHPTTDLDLLAQFDDQDIEDAAALTAAIRAGTLIWRRQAGGVAQATDSYDSYSAMRDELGFADPSLSLIESEDWFTDSPTGKLNWTDTTIGGGSLVSATGFDQSSPGVVTVTAGQAAGRIAVLSVGEVLQLAGGDVKFSWVVRIPTLPTATNDAVFRIGLGDAVTAVDNVDGVYFEYNRSVSTNWLVKTASNSTRTSTATATTVVASQWRKLVCTVNPAGTSAKFFIDGTLVATHTTNIPTGAGRLCGPHIMAHTTAGNATQSILADYFRISHRFTNAR